MPKRGAFALGLTTFALVLLLNFQAPSLAPASSTGTGTGGTGNGGTGSTRTGSGTGGTANGTGGTSSGTGTGGTPSGTGNGTGGTANGTGGTGNGTGGTGGPAATAAGERTVDGPVVGTRFGSVQVEVTLDGTKIVDVAAIQLPSGDRRTNQISSYVEPILRSEALQAQSANIDGISGATYTSNAYARSLQAALDSAGI
jgi:uncharacterized protein with FMN-binding domain